MTSAPLRPKIVRQKIVRRAIAHLAALALASTAILAGTARAQGLGAQGPGAQAPMQGELLGAPPMAGTDMVGRTVALDLGAGGGPTRTLAIPQGKSAVIALPVDARDVMVTDHKVADVVLSTPRRIYVLGLSAGQTDATFVDGMGRQILHLNVRVDQDTSAVSETFARLLPGSNIHAEAVNQSVILTGEAPSASDADKAVRIATSFVSHPEQVINMLTITQPEQVMLKVRIVEVNRQVVKQLGVNLSALISKVGDSNFSFAQVATYGVNGALEGGATAGEQYANRAGTKTVDAVIGAFERVGLIRTLAEPNLTTVSGESAKFLAGGEFPVPAGTALTASVEYKDFGVGLGFTPVVLSKGRISLKLSTEYSVLSSVGALTVAGGASTNLSDGASSSSSGTGGTSPTTTSNTNTASTTYPALSVRRAETVVELPSGGSMMIAGLLQSTTQQDIDSLPGLMQLPVLGALFRSRDFQQNETELVVIVTPYLVKSTSLDRIQTPADGLLIADDFSSVLLGRLNESFSKRAKPPVGQTYQGPFGYVVE